MLCCFKIILISFEKNMLYVYNYYYSLWEFFILCLGRMNILINYLLMLIYRRLLHKSILLCHFKNKMLKQYIKRGLKSWKNELLSNIYDNFV